MGSCPAEINGGICFAGNNDIDCADCIKRNLSLKKVAMKIRCAAIFYKGIIYAGKSHSEIGIHLCNEGIVPEGEMYPGGDAQGFVTECGIFVNRNAAFVIALKAGQIVEGKTFQPDKLFSEDLK
jgi:hypothetical protein